MLLGIYVAIKSKIVVGIEFQKIKGGKMARKRREMGLIEVINKWLSDFGDKLLGKEKPKPKKKKTKRKTSKKKS